MSYFERFAYYKTPQLTDSVSPDVDLIIVIPCHNESDIMKTLDSVANCDPPYSGRVEIIVVVNASQTASEVITKQNKDAMRDMEAWHQRNGWLSLLIMEEALPPKHAGVGLARKIGMDEAARRFEFLGKNGVIVALDADCSVDKNYIRELTIHLVNTKAQAASIRFEHPLNQSNGPYITNYELHLRYFINAQRWCGFPYAYQTVGSSMAVKSKTYQQVGGMPKKQAGEDFYFLHKVIPLGGFIQINTTVVRPSPRISRRVPFGTGRDMLNQQQTSDSEYKTYAFHSFEALKPLFSNLDKLYHTSFSDVKKDMYPEVIDFLNVHQFESKIKEILSHVASETSFRKRFFQWFNAFMIMKYCHFLRDHCSPNCEVLSQSNLLASRISLPVSTSTEEALIHWRTYDARTSKT